MAEIKTGIFAKNVQKRLSRAQEKVRRSGSVTGGDCVERDRSRQACVCHRGRDAVVFGGSCPA